MNFEGIYNLYEHLVFEEIRNTLDDPNSNFSPDDTEDVACVALNHLPPRYVNHSIDIAYFIKDEEKQAMQKAALEAVNNAIAFVKQHPGLADRD